MPLSYYAGIIIVLIVTCAAGLSAGKNIKSARQFNGEKSLGITAVTGALVGSLAGGSATIGTAQLAFYNGFSAIWFTLGGSLGLLILCFINFKKMKDSGSSTIPGIISLEYGDKSGTICAMITSSGSFITIVSQMMSLIVLFKSFLIINKYFAAILAILLMFSYVVFGGTAGVGKSGIIKTALIFCGIGSCGLLAIIYQGGISSFLEVLPKNVYFNPFSRGIAVDLGVGISAAVGMLTTQSYYQALLSAKNINNAKSASVISAFIVTIMGIFGVFTGMYMKIHFPDIDPAAALPAFTIKFMPPLMSGLILGGLLIAAVGTGAGISLGVGTMICRDIYVASVNPGADEKKQLRVTRISIIIILSFAALLATGSIGSLVMTWSAMAMGLRGACALAPLFGALYLKNKIKRPFACFSMFAGPGLVALLKAQGFSLLDPLIPAIMLSFAVLIMGYKRDIL